MDDVRGTVIGSSSLRHVRDYVFMVYSYFSNLLSPHPLSKEGYISLHMSVNQSVCNSPTSHILGRRMCSYSSIRLVLVSVSVLITQIKMFTSVSAFSLSKNSLSSVVSSFLFEIIKLLFVYIQYMYFVYWHGFNLSDAVLLIINFLHYTSPIEVEGFMLLSLSLSFYLRAKSFPYSNFTIFWPTLTCSSIHWYIAYDLERISIDSGQNVKGKGQTWSLNFIAVYAIVNSLFWSTSILLHTCDYHDLRCTLLTFGPKGQRLGQILDLNFFAKMGIYHAWTALALVAHYA